MFIQTEQTPNPNTLKFLPGQEVMKTGTVTFTNAEEAAKSPLAEALFAIVNVEGVFFGSDFVTVTKKSDTDWSSLKAPILTTIMEHYVSGVPLMAKEGTEKVSATSSTNEDDDEIVAQIKELIDTKVRPAVAEDGGDIVYRGFEDGIVKLELHGSCSGCPSSTVTLKSGIENMLKHYIPEVEGVESVSGEG